MCKLQVVACADKQLVSSAARAVDNSWAVSPSPDRRVDAATRAHSLWVGSYTRRSARNPDKAVEEATSVCWRVVESMLRETKSRDRSLCLLEHASYANFRDGHPIWGLAMLLGGL